MENIKKFLSDEEFDHLSNMNIKPWVCYQSIMIIKSDAKNPIYIMHDNIPSITEKNENDEILEDVSDNYVVGDYENTPIKFFDLIFSDLNNRTYLGDSLLLTTNGLFSLCNANIDFDKKHIYYDDVSYHGL